RRREAGGPRAALHSRAGSPGPGGAAAPGGRTVRVTRPRALDGSLDLARALRPLRRPADAPGRAALDEEATAEATAETGILLPAWRPAREPYFSVDLLVDTGATMAVWHRLADELGTLLERHGAFADVRRWSLRTDLDAPALAPLRRHSPAVPPVPRSGWFRPLLDPTGRRILLVLTDGVGPAWYGEELPGFLAATAATRPAAALQVLPRRLWHRTALRTAPVEARASDTGRPVPVFRSEAALPGIPRGARGAAERARVRWLPVLEVDADWLAPWARLTAGRACGWTPMLAAPLGGVPRPQRPAGHAEGPATPAERVARFRAGSSPTAYRLACHLAAAPLSLPVMRLVQQAAVPESGQTDLAELFVSGLLEPPGAAAGDPDEQIYAFRSGVRAELLTELSRTESVDVLALLAKVSGRVAATFGGTLDFRALATVGGDGAPPSALSERSRVFAEVAVEVLAGAGGRHAEDAARLASALERSALERSARDGAAARTAPTVPAAAPGAPTSPALRPDRLVPVPPVQSPPDPPVMIGRRGALAELAEAFSPTRTVTRPGLPDLVILTGALGTGRRRLVQEYVGAFGGSHPFVHWIDARRPGTLRTGLSRLWQAVGPAGALLDESSLAPLWRQLARHQDWLVVLDDVPRGAWASDSELPFFLPRHGRGCVVVTTESIGSWRPPTGARVVRLGALDTDEVVDELRRWLGPEHDAADPAVERALRRLARRLPRVPVQLAARNLAADVAEALAAPGPRNGIAEEEALVQAGIIRIPPSRRIPLQTLPAASRAFTGRAVELGELISFLTPAEPGTDATRAAVVSGLPGVGKTELVLQAAERVLAFGWYPGGVLYLDLAGNRSGEALTTEKAVELLLRSLDTNQDAIPADHQYRLLVHRAALARYTREFGPVLMVLDNAASAAQVAPLLPTDGAVSVLVSSRSVLSLDARLFEVGVLTAEASVRLLENRLRKRLGHDTRIADAPDQARALAELCGRLPLALTLCAGQLAQTPSRPVASLVEQLTDPRRRLDLIRRDEQSVRTAFDISYRQLPGDQARLFRLLSVFPHPDLTTEAAARLADLDARETGILLSALADTHLVGYGSAWGRWSVHSLLTLYAVGLREDHADNRDQALERLLTHYRSAVESAVQHLDHGFTDRFRSPAEVRTWVDFERPVLLPLVRYAAFTLATPLTALLVRVRGFDDLATVVDTVLAALRRDDNREDEAGFLERLRLELDGRPPGEDVPEDQRTAFEQLSRLTGDSSDRKAVHLLFQLRGADVRTAKSVVTEILVDLAADPEADGTVLDLDTALQVTLTGERDPLAAVGRAIVRVWQAMSALPAGTRPPLGLAVFTGPHDSRAPGRQALMRRLATAPRTPYSPIAALTVSGAVLDLVSDRLGTGEALRFTQVEGAHLYNGDAYALGGQLADVSGS
ncbi:SAV_2336 N-terminal domain-related protein, partial [Kitasatospora sp. NPDC059462]|uniref:SAV_2336 N-terminal domain-related protein n=2 Tax=unclassified Kitasatospora TaxID=2633591 RepID=UPI0036C8CFE5